MMPYTLEIIAIIDMLIIICTFLVFRMVKTTRKQNETFSNRGFKSKIYNILPAFDLDFCGIRKSTKETNPMYIATFLPDN